MEISSDVMPHLKQASMQKDKDQGIVNLSEQHNHFLILTTVIVQLLVNLSEQYNHAQLFLYFII